MSKYVIESKRWYIVQPSVVGDDAGVEILYSFCFYIDMVQAFKDKHPFAGVTDEEAMLRHQLANHPDYFEILEIRKRIAELPLMLRRADFERLNVIWRETKSWSERFKEEK